MAVTQSIKDALYKRAGGRCECTMRVCSHHAAGIRCPNKLTGEWNVHHRTTTGPDNLGNITAMCIRCHKNTGSFGRGPR